jgi:D-glycero-alpha-D-manno-heptose-7-phosphate kinase
MREQNAAALEALFALKAAAVDMKQALLAGNVASIGAILNGSWLSKRQTSDAISTDFIERLFQIGRQAGAKAGKISGAGGGGFIMFLVEPEDRTKVVGDLNSAGGVAGPVHLTSRGVETWEQPGSER